MVTVRKHRPIDQGGELDIQQWVDGVLAKAGAHNEDSSMLKKACELAGSLESVQGDKITGWGTGYTTFNAGLDMAEMLADLQLDAVTLTAAVLYRSFRENKVSSDTIRKEFSDDIADLLKGVQDMAAVSAGINHTATEVLGEDSTEQSEKIRRMLVAMVDDVRIALVKLAERTCAIRAVKNAPLEKRQRVAREIAEVYAPLAQRLGIGHLKWELEDLSFRYLQPFDYKYIAKLLSEKRLDRQQYIDKILELIRKELAAENIDAEVYGRAKHIYSIWKKMRRKGIDFSEVYDIRAVRILVGSVRECYSVLGIVHSLWRNLPHEFDDYIANPKENGYQSLHTAVRGPEDQIIEIQIRTQAMHEAAEYGVCAHWLYKNADKEETGSSYDQKIEWLRQVLEWQEEIGKPQDDEQPDFSKQDRIYVFTPEGHVVDLPAGATPIDFAFRIHTDIGIRCRGAKVNGKIVPLNHKLKTSNQIEILTSKREAPSRDWLNSSLGYITTSKARSRLHQWFRMQDRDQNMADGRSILEREIKRLGISGIDFSDLVKRLGLQSLDELHVALGTADISLERVLAALQRQIQSNDDIDQPVVSTVGKVTTTDNSAEVFIDGVGSMMSHIAQCCDPVPGDAIAGYITLGRGVAIHSRECSDFLHLQAEEADRIIAVEWAEEPRKLYSADVVIEAFDRHGLLRDITRVIDSEKVNVSAMNTLSNKNKSTVDMVMTMEISDFSKLSRVMTKISQISNITSVRRKQ